MKVVFKYELEILNTQRIPMPKGAQILSFQFKGRHLVIWALVDTALPREGRTFRLVSTGEAVIETNVTFIGTAVDPDIKLSYHLFEITV